MVSDNIETTTMLTSAGLLICYKENTHAHWRFVNSEKQYLNILADVCLKVSFKSHSRSYSFTDSGKKACILNQVTFQGHDDCAIFCDASGLSLQILLTSL